MLTPDCTGSFFSGLMGTIFTYQYSDNVWKLILLTLTSLRPQLASYLDLEPVSIPTTMIHGTMEDAVPLEPVHTMAGKIFTNLTWSKTIIVRKNQSMNWIGKSYLHEYRPCEGFESSQG